MRPLSKRPGETRLFLGRLCCDPGRPTMVDPLPYEGSASLRTLALAEVMIILHPDEVDIGEGDLVEILSI